MFAPQTEGPGCRSSTRLQRFKTIFEASPSTRTFGGYCHRLITSFGRGIGDGGGERIRVQMIADKDRGAFRTCNIVHGRGSTTIYT